MRFPKTPKPPRFRAGIFHHRSAATNVDATTLSMFHMACTNGFDTRLAAAHQACIDRERASVFSIGNISDDPKESKHFSSDPEREMHRRLGTLRALPAPARPTGAPAIPHAISDAIHRAWREIKEPEHPLKPNSKRGIIYFS